MAIGAVLVDRARTLTKQAASARVEGTTSMAEVRGTWFRARLFLVGAPESRTPGPDVVGRVKAVSTPQLMCGVRDLDGGTLAFNFDQRLEVKSPELGNAVWKITGDPEPMRKKRAVLGWLLELEKVDEGDMEPFA